jgi:hypothetical protein
MDLLTPSKEVFIWFVVLLDIVCYHSESLLPSLDKYDNHFSDKDKDATSEFIEIVKKNGVLTTTPLSAHKPFKGYRTKDTFLFMIVKKQVLADQKKVAPDIDLPSGNPPTTGVIPFTFSFPESIASIKVEHGDLDSNKKRKLPQDEAASLVSPSMAMEFDDGDFLFNYTTTVANIPFYGA